MILTTILTAILTFFSISEAEELFSAVTDVRHFLQDDLVPFLENHENKSKLQGSKDKLIALNQEFPEGEEGEKYLSDPITGYYFLKQIASAWEFIKKDFDHLGSVEEIEQNIPSNDDFRGVRLAVLRLQDLYQINASRMVSSHEKVTALDCYEIGLEAYSRKQYTRTTGWMREAQRILETEDEKTVDETNIMRYMFFSTLRQWKFTMAFLTLLQLVGLGSVKTTYTEDLRVAAAEYRLTESNAREDLYYTQLCRGDPTAMALASQARTPLTCHYFTNNYHPELVLAPVKVEVISERPYVVRYYDVISDAEIDSVKRLARKRLQPAMVDDVNMTRVKSTIRVSKFVFLNETTHRQLLPVRNRVGAITGLDMRSSEMIQVVNYGIGGFYAPHYDESANHWDWTGQEGRRIATVLIYLSDVEVGGATVFTKAFLRAEPIKGSAIFWWNLQRSGNLDYSTLHAGCPVMYGTKWVANYWIQDIGQLFTRPCSLKKNE